MARNCLSLEQKLLTKTAARGDCLIWTGQRDRRGYGFLRIDGRLRRAHRLMVELHRGAIPKGAVVMHLCDNPSCIAIAHLAVGSQRENVHDMHNKGRAVFLRGADNPKSKLTAGQVADIRRRYQRYSREDGGGALALEYGVTKAAILAIVTGKTWT